MPKSTSDIDRRMASRLLGVSVRTVDRYIRSGRLLARQADGRIWLNKNDIQNFKQGNRVPVYMTPTRRDKVTTSVSAKRELAQQQNTDFYKDLYEEARRALHEYQQKLEQATYRIGTLESSIFQPPHHPKSQPQRDDSAALEFLKKELSDREKEITLIKDLARREKSSRIIFAVLVYILLALLPAFWYFLQ